MRNILFSIMLFVVLAACLPLPEQSQTAVSKPLVPDATGVMAIQSPKEGQPVLESKPKVPQEVVTPPITVTVVPPPVESKSCKEQCADDCALSAQVACSKSERVDCKANCGSIADPSACTQACSYLHQPSSCRSILEKACASQCVGLCH